MPDLKYIPAHTAETTAPVNPQTDDPWQDVELVAAYGHSGTVTLTVQPLDSTEVNMIRLHLTDELAAELERAIQTFRAGT